MKTKNSFAERYNVTAGLILSVLTAALASTPYLLSEKTTLLEAVIAGGIGFSYTMLLWLLAAWFYYLFRVQFRFMNPVFFFLAGEGMIWTTILLRQIGQTEEGGSFFWEVISFHVVFTVFHAVIFFMQRSQILERERGIVVLENERLLQENLKSQYEALKQQINPHFLFNSLNAVKSMIYTHPEQAEKYIIQLSQVYRYVLSNRLKSLMNVSEELAFTDSYIHLLKIRYESNFIITQQVPETVRDFYIVPLSVQMLIENAVKHNIVSSDAPLSIDIRITSDNRLVVTNTLNLRQEVEGAGNFGLYNLKMQYSYLGKYEVKIVQTAISFAVSLPLIEKTESL